jgi:hypothetical protein
MHLRFLVVMPMKTLSHLLLLALCLALSACAALPASAPTATPLPRPKLVEFYSPV